MTGPRSTVTQTSVLFSFITSLWTRIGVYSRNFFLLYYKYGAKCNVSSQVADMRRRNLRSPGEKGIRVSNKVYAFPYKLDAAMSEGRRFANENRVKAHAGIIIHAANGVRRGSPWRDVMQITLRSMKIMPPGIFTMH